MTRFGLFAIALLLTTGAVVAAPVSYTLDPGHTQVVASWSHFGFSHPAARFHDVVSDFQFDAADPTKSSIVVTIPIDSVDSGVPKLDEHLKGPDFFDAKRFPAATFKSERVERSGENGLKVSGQFTLHGVTRPLVLDVTINKIGEHPMGGPAAGFDAKATIKRSDFGITKYVPNVSDEIAIAITTESAPAKPASAEAAAKQQ
jgi:polyisoprenoid-binding protein YceI